MFGRVHEDSRYVCRHTSFWIRYRISEHDRSTARSLSTAGCGPGLWEQVRRRSG